MHKTKPTDTTGTTGTTGMTDIVLQILNQIQHEPAAQIEEIVEKGSVNRVFSVKTEQGDRILRLREEPSAYWEYQKEKWCLHQAHKAGIPSPDVLAIGEHQGIAYVMETCVPGVNGHLLPEQSLLIWQKLGQYARRFNQINVSGFGLDFQTEPEEAFYNSFTPTWDAHVDYNINSLGCEDIFIDLRVYRQDQIGFLSCIFEELKCAIQSGRLKIGLNHGDLSPRNLMVAVDGTMCLIDWGCALAHVAPHYDMACLLKGCLLDGNPSTESFEAFLSGYGIDSTVFENMKADIHHIMLLDAFDKLRWAIDRSPSDVEAFTKVARQMLALQQAEDESKS